MGTKKKVRRVERPLTPAEADLTDAQAALLAHADTWHRSSGVNPEGCSDCRRLVLAVTKERAVTSEVSR
jgi:hypothetical protein